MNSPWEPGRKPYRYLLSSPLRLQVSRRRDQSEQPNCLLVYLEPQWIARLRPICMLRFVVPICRPREIMKQIGAFVLVFVAGISFVAGIFRPLWYKKVYLLFIKRPFFPSRFTFNIRYFAKGYVRLGCKIGPDTGKSVRRSQIFPNRPTCRTEIERASGPHLHAPICFTISRGRQIGTTNRSV